MGDYLRGPYERKQDWSHEERRVEQAYRRLGVYKERDPRRVYFTTDRELARGWATHEVLQREGGGALYRVRPVPPSSMEPDPDIAVTGFSARSAEVLEVVEDPVQMADEDAIRAMNLKYSLWTDGSPMYDYDGYMLPSPELRAVGASSDLLRHFGTWFTVPPEHVVAWDETDRPAFVAPRSALGLPG